MLGMELQLIGNRVRFNMLADGRVNNVGVNEPGPEMVIVNVLIDLL